MTSIWENTSQRNIMFQNKCSENIYVGTEFSAGSDDSEHIIDCTNESHDINNLPYSAMTPAELAAIKNTNSNCPNFRQIIANVPAHQTISYPLSLYQKEDNKCNTGPNEWCRASVKMFPMIINDSDTSVDNIRDTFVNASLSQGLTEFTFGADPKEDKTAGDDNYDISAIIRQGACSAHSNPYENDYGYANLNEPECKTNPVVDGVESDFNESVVYNTVDLGKVAAQPTNSQNNGCSLNHKGGCGSDQQTVRFYGCGMPRIYTPNGASAERSYELKMEENIWELYDRLTGEKLTDEPRQEMLTEIRKEIFKCSYAQAKLNAQTPNVRSPDSIFSFIPFKLEALNELGESYDGCSNGTKTLKCLPANGGDPGSLISNCPGGYSYQYDDFVGGVTCTPPLYQGDPTYKITYCPDGEDPGPSPPSPIPNPSPSPSDRSTCSTLYSCVGDMITDPLKENDLCIGKMCDINVDSNTCCKDAETSYTGFPVSVDPVNNIDARSVSNDNTKYISQIDDRPRYDGSNREKNTSKTHVMKSSEYTPVGIDEGTSYSFLNKISSGVKDLGNRGKSIGLQPNHFFW